MPSHVFAAPTSYYGTPTGSAQFAVPSFPGSNLAPDSQYPTTPLGTRPSGVSLPANDLFSVEDDAGNTGSDSAHSDASLERRIILRSRKKRALKGKGTAEKGMRKAEMVGGKSKDSVTDGRKAKGGLKSQPGSVGTTTKKMKAVWSDAEDGILRENTETGAYLLEAEDQELLEEFLPSNPTMMAFFLACPYSRAAAMVSRWLPHARKDSAS